MQDTVPVECTNCGFTFLNEVPTKSTSCPKCGSRAIKFHQNVGGGQLKPRGLMKLKAYKPPSKHKKKRAAIEIEKGGRIGRDGKAVSIERVIDRDSNRYKETIKAENDQTMVNKDEKLSEHRKKPSP